MSTMSIDDLNKMSEMMQEAGLLNTHRNSDMFDSMSRFLPMGIPYFEDVNAVENVYEEVKRTFKERFFSWPWKPWVTHKTIITGTRPCAFMINERMLMFHPALTENLKNIVSGINIAIS